MQFKFEDINGRSSLRRRILQGRRGGISMLHRGSLKYLKSYKGPAPGNYVENYFLIDVTVNENGKKRKQVWEIGLDLFPPLGNKKFEDAVRIRLCQCRIAENEDGQMVELTDIVYPNIIEPGDLLRRIEKEYIQAGYINPKTGTFYRYEENDQKRKPNERAPEKRVTEDPYPAMADSVIRDSYIYSVQHGRHPHGSSKFSDKRGRTICGS